LRRAAAGALAAVALAGCGKHAVDTGAGSIPFDGRSPAVPTTGKVRLLVQLQRPSLGGLAPADRAGARTQRDYVASLESESRALQSALRAKGIRIESPRLYARVWNGFAATIASTDVPAVRALGLRTEPVRRFFGASSMAASGGAAPKLAAAATRTPAVALLDSGVDRAAPDLRGRVAAGFDAVGGKPAAAGHGEAMARVLAGALGAKGGSVLSVRVAGAGGATTDALLSGLERTVDPNGDGDTSDAVPVALVGVNSPYAGFPDSPEAEAADAARQLGTLVVAPAGNEGRRVGRFGTIGSPGAAPGALAVAALDGRGPGVPGVKLGIAGEDGRARLDGSLLGGGGKAFNVPVTGLSGPNQANPRAKGRAAGADPLEYFGVDARPRAKGMAVVVPARDAAGHSPPLAARAAAAAEAGARALVVCEPDESRPLPALPDGAGNGMAVIGLRGGDAGRVLDLTAKPGGTAFVSAPEPREAGGAVRLGYGSSQGPTYGLDTKPDLAAPGTATVSIRGRGRFVAGTSVAAARVAAAAARIASARPSASPDDIAAALSETARPSGALLAAGGGELDAAAALRVQVAALPRVIALRSQPTTATTVSRGVTFANRGARPLRLSLRFAGAGMRGRISPAAVTVPAGGRRAVTLRISRPRHAPAFLTGALTATGGGTHLTVPVGVPVGPPPPARLGQLRLVMESGRAAGVRFTAGAVARPGGMLAVEPVGVLRLELVAEGGRTVRELTPPGGAPDVLPGEYAYTLTKATRDSLAPGRYRFVARAMAVAGGREARAESPSFTVR
jgi:hypothetical protein